MQKSSIENPKLIESAKENSARFQPSNLPTDSISDREIQKPFSAWAFPASFQGHTQ